MQISALIGSSPAGPISSTASLLAQFQQAIKDLQNTLKTGDTNGAKTALARLQGLTQGGGSDQLTADLNTIGQALGAGNVTAAQGAFAALQGDLAAPAPQPAAYSSSGLTIEDVVTILSALPGASGSSTASSSTDIGSNLLSALSASSSAANLAAASKSGANSHAAATPVTPTPAPQLNLYA